MKKTFAGLVLGLAITLSVSSAQAGTIVLAVGDAYYLGAVDINGSANEVATVGHLNFLLDMAVLPSTASSGGSDYYRSSLACPNPATCPDATTVGDSNNIDANIATTLDVTNWTYLAGKYAGVLFYWHVANINSPDLAQLPASLGGACAANGGKNGCGLSHYYLANPTAQRVPDTGSALGLLGLGMFGIGYLRSRRR